MAHRNVANGTGPRQQQRRRGGTGSAWMAAGTTTAVACGLLLVLIDPAYTGAYGDSVDDDWTVTAAEVRSGYRPTLPPTTVPPPTAPAAARAGVPDGDGGVRAEADRNLRTGAETGGGLSGEVIAWVAGFGVLLVVWCAGWRLRPRGARIVVRQSDDPQRAPSDTADDPEPVRIEL